MADKKALTDDQEEEEEEEERRFHELVATVKLLLGDAPEPLRANVIGLALGANVLTASESDQINRFLSNAETLMQRIANALKPENGAYPMGQLNGVRLHDLAEQSQQQLTFANIVVHRYRDRK